VSWFLKGKADLNIQNSFSQLRDSHVDLCQCLKRTVNSQYKKTEQIGICGAAFAMLVPPNTSPRR
jgi:hypothetical protein